MMSLNGIHFFCHLFLDIIKVSNNTVCQNGDNFSFKVGNLAWRIGGRVENPPPSSRSSLYLLQEQVRKRDLIWILTAEEEERGRGWRKWGNRERASVKSYWKGKERVWHLPKKYLKLFPDLKSVYVCHRCCWNYSNAYIVAVFCLKKLGGQQSFFSPDPDISSCVFNPRGEKEREREKHLAWLRELFLSPEWPSPPLPKAQIFSSWVSFLPRPEKCASLKFGIRFLSEPGRATRRWKWAEVLPGGLIRKSQGTGSKGTVCNFCKLVIPQKAIVCPHQKEQEVRYNHWQLWIEQGRNGSLGEIIAPVRNLPTSNWGHGMCTPV